MGSFCPNCFKKSFKSYYLNSKISAISFSTQNDECFYIPHRYTTILSKLSTIINSESEFWNEHKHFLQEAKKYLYEQLNSLDNFIFKEDNICESSIKERKSLLVSNSPESPVLIQMSDMKIQDSNENEFKRGRGSTLTSYIDYNEKFRLKKFIFEINRLMFLGENDPNDQNMKDPRIELEFFPNYENNSIKKTIKFQSKSHPNALNPIWNEIFEIDLPELLEISSLQRIQFSISLVYKNARNGNSIILGEKYLFSFSELSNQMLYEKIINIKNKRDRPGGCFAILLFRCQLIHDYFKLLNYWKNEIEVKLEIINRIIQKIAFEEKGQKLKRIALNNYRLENEIEGCVKGVEEKKKKELQKNISLMSGDNSDINLSSIYENQYYIK